MSDSSNIKPFLVSTLTFMGGMATGFLLASEKGAQNRIWLSRQIKNLTRQRPLQPNSEADSARYDIYELRHQIHEGIQQNIPDAYEATEYIPLSEREILHG